MTTGSSVPNFTKWKAATGNRTGDRLLFNNATPTKQQIVLFPSLLPSEKKKPGYITASIDLAAEFDQIDQETFIGLQIEELDEEQTGQLFMGINGAGEIQVLDGKFNPLKDETIETNGDLNLNAQDELTLSFHYYQNPDGWVLYMELSNDDNKVTSIINHIPFEKLDFPAKGIALVVKNPGQKGKIWFNNWKIWNDWTPND